MAGAGDRLPRLLALVPWLLNHPGARLADVAQEFGISEKVLVDDLNLVFLCGLPGHGPGDLIEVAYEGDRIYVRNADTIARPLRLTADEALALVVALRTLAEVPSADGGDAVRRALAKVETAAEGDPAGGVAVALEGETDVVATARSALDRGRRLHLVHHVPDRDETTERDVDPMRLVIAGGRPYLEAWCRRVEDVRLFRLDRVLELTVLDVAAEVPEQATPRDISAGVFVPSPEDLLVTLEVDPAARWVADYYACETVTELPDGGLRVDLRTPDTSGVRRLLLRLGPHGRAVAPPELAAAVRADAREALKAYDA